MLHTVWSLYLGFFFITFPATFLLLHYIITELLDLVFNTDKIDKLLSHSDNFNYQKLENEYQNHKTLQCSINKNFLNQLKMIEYYNNKSKSGYRRGQNKIITSINLLDLFKVN